jgi:DNA-binding transcriptional ArsR family regulator
VSQHLRVLRDTGVVTVRRDAERRLYSLKRDGLADLDHWLNGVRRFWAGRLDALQEELEKPEHLKERGTRDE